MKILDPITTVQAGKILDCDPSAIRHRIKSGTLESEQVGRDRLVSKAQVLKILSERNGAKRGPKRSRRKSMRRSAARGSGGGKESTRADEGK